MSSVCRGVVLFADSPVSLSEFYREALSFSYNMHDQLRLSLGANTDVVEIRQDEAPEHERYELLSNDPAFLHIAIEVQDIDACFAAVIAAGGKPFAAAPQTIPQSNPVSGGVKAAYFHDPEGHAFELLEFPCSAEAHRPSRGRAFLDVNHSARVVADTERALTVYRDLFGMRVEARSLNEGPEQARLSGVADARVRITALRGAGGPGIELLEYLSPGHTSRKANDRTLTVLYENDIAGLRNLLRKRVDELHAEFSGDGATIALRDIDGHRLCVRSAE